MMREHKFVKAPSEQHQALMRDIGNNISVLRWSQDSKMDISPRETKRAYDVVYRKRLALAELCDSENEETHGRALHFLKTLLDLEKKKFGALQSVAVRIIGPRWERFVHEYQAPARVIEEGEDIHRSIVDRFLHVARQRREALPFARKCIEGMYGTIEGLVARGLSMNAEGLLDHAFALSSKAKLDSLKASLREQGADLIGRNNDHGSRFCAELMCSKNSALAAFGKNLTAEMLARFGIDGAEFVDTWELGTDEKELRTYFIENIKRLQELERRIPGGVQLLRKKFGIRHFGRYPIELLADQCENAEKDMPYGIALLPFTDHNGGFFQKFEMWKNIRSDLAKTETGYALRIGECGSALQVFQLLSRLNHRHGEHHKISFALIAGHGTKNSIEFGGKDEPHRLHVSHLRPSRQGYYSRKFFADRPLFILWSCSTGKQGGIAQRLSKALLAEVIGPAADAGIQSLSLHEKNKKLDCEVKYWAPVKEGGFVSRYVTIPALRYKGGNLRGIS